MLPIAKHRRVCILPVETEPEHPLCLCFFFLSINSWKCYLDKRWDRHLLFQMMILWFHIWNCYHLVLKDNPDDFYWNLMTGKELSPSQEAWGYHVVLISTLLPPKLSSCLIDSHYSSKTAQFRLEFPSAWHLYPGRENILLTNVPAKISGLRITEQSESYRCPSTNNSCDQEMEEMN